MKLGRFAKGHFGASVFASLQRPSLRKIIHVQKRNCMPMKTHTPTSDVIEDDLITSAETCDLLRISRPTLHRYVRQKHLQPKRLPGGQLRFHRSEVLQLLV